MRLLYFAPNYLPATRYGGPIRSSHGLAKALVDRGHEVEVFTTNVDGPRLIDVAVGKPIDVDGVSVRYFAIEPPRRLYYSPSMGVALDAAAARFDVVHINGMFLWPGPRAASAASRANVPFIVSPRGMLAPELIAGKSTIAKMLWIRAFEKSTLRRAAAIHVTSDTEASGLRHLGLDLAPLAIVPNGVEGPLRLPDSAAIDRHWGDVPSGQRVAFLGRLDWKKGVDLAVDAVSAVPHAALRIAGHDQIGLRGPLEARLDADGLSQRIRFVGPLDGMEKWAFLFGADLLVVPSINENFGIVVAEALCVGTPVICTEGVGAGALVGLIDRHSVVPRTREALVAAVTRLLGNSRLREHYAREAIDLIATRFTWPAVAGQMLEIYEDVRARRA